jgi:hypothetical protein
MMRTSMAVCLSGCWGFGLAVALSATAFAQVPTRASEPRLALPRAQPTATAQPAATPEASAPTAAASPDTTPPPSDNAPVTQVTSGGGVTKLGTGGQPDTGAQPTSSSSQAATAAYSSAGRGYAAGKFALTLSGLPVGWLVAAEGGDPGSEVVVEKVGADHIARKHLSGIQYEDITIATGLDAKPIIDWIAESWDGKYNRKDGSVVMAGSDYRAKAERQFFHTLIRETTFPKLDASSREAARLTVKLAPEYTRLVSGSGTPVAGPTMGSKTGKWLVSNFRFEMAGLDPQDLNYVTSIESFTVGQKLPEHPIGETRDYAVAPSEVEFPNLKVTFNAGSAQSWYNWLDDFVVKGNNGQEKERDGAIVFQNPSTKGDYGRVNLFNCGIVRISSEKQDPRSDAVRRLQAELYCERMQLVTSKTG